MATDSDPRGYLVAPLFSPTVHVLLTPIWSVLSNHANEAVASFIWQFIAWFALEAICLATMCPVLWLCRNHVSKLALGRSTAWFIVSLLAAVASYFLFQSAVVSWCAAFASAVLIFARFQNDENCSLQALPSSNFNALHRHPNHLE
jgi:hypothetical protein